eukprot:9297123-Karenia_brevis.AAC.1
MISCFQQALYPDRPTATVHIDVRSKLDTVDFRNICHDLMPNGEAADIVASKAAKLRGKKVTKPFPYVDLKNFVPIWAAGKVAEDKSYSETP